MEWVQYHLGYSERNSDRGYGLYHAIEEGKAACGYKPRNLDTARNGRKFQSRGTATVPLTYDRCQRCSRKVLNEG